MPGAGERVEMGSNYLTGMELPFGVMKMLWTTTELMVSHHVMH